MANDTCRSCDGRTVKVREDKDNVFKSIETVCTRCNGTGFEPGPSKGKRRFFRQKDENLDMTIEEQTQKFLREHGY